VLIHTETLSCAAPCTFDEDAQNRLPVNSIWITGSLFHHETFDSHPHHLFSASLLFHKRSSTGTRKWGGAACINHYKSNVQVTRGLATYLQSLFLSLPTRCNRHLRGQSISSVQQRRPPDRQLVDQTRLFRVSQYLDRVDWHISTRQTGISCYCASNRQAGLNCRKSRVKGGIHCILRNNHNRRLKS
jgi:hypothetical protein